ncbi:hypothetical protein R5W24_000557 [Gemmata sp. JC717]|uniref:hypothetical protein n=1 Tax=Gemmata algarum TaxID=2975278 RepID=UPI0021BA550A|nr:hypothetical protein [Gemmata algarum]MDY3551481.1 hypothetical protein [Gemmata algarum]
MSFITDMIKDLILFLVVVCTIATIVGRKYAEKYPDEAKRVPIQAGKAVAGWLFKLFKGR